MRRELSLFNLSCDLDIEVSSQGIRNLRQRMKLFSFLGFGTVVIPHIVHQERGKPDVLLLRTLDSKASALQKERSSLCMKQRDWYRYREILVVQIEGACWFTYIHNLYL